MIEWYLRWIRDMGEDLRKEGDRLRADASALPEDPETLAKAVRNLNAHIRKRGRNVLVRGIAIRVLEELMWAFVAVAYSKSFLAALFRLGERIRSGTLAGGPSFQTFAHFWDLLGVIWTTKVNRDVWTPAMEEMKIG